MNKAAEYFERFGSILVKADLGGGGKGMKIIRSQDELQKIFESAQREANMTFGRSSIYVEKALERPRHIEVQILTYKFGNVIFSGKENVPSSEDIKKLLKSHLPLWGMKKLGNTFQTLPKK
jgi:acetyl/propionyl-CoA carboxylase alpha subunit